MAPRVSQLCELDVINTYQFVTQAVESPLVNVCNLKYTLITKKPDDTGRISRTQQFTRI